MAFKLESPIKWPRMTTEDFRKKKEEYFSKYGYTVHIPGFKDIIKWDTTPEPTEEELYYYKAKDIQALSLKRYTEIKILMEKKRENFLRILSAPTPDIVHNATSILTALDDVNDTLGTLVVVGRIIARRLPRIAFKLFIGPAGWTLTAADIAGIALDLTRMPFKARNIQHNINELVKGHPLSKKARLKRLNKLKRLRLTKGEIIEGLQTTENMFGIGLCLGPIFSLLTDIPAGLYHHAMGKKVTISGLPGPLLWFDRLWSRALKSLATLWTGLPVDFDQDLGKGMVVSNLAIQTYRNQYSHMSPIDFISDIEDIMLLAPIPYHPSTKLVVENELGDASLKIGWPFSSEKYIPVNHIFDIGLPKILENLEAWRERNKRDLESMVGAQNAAEAGLYIMGALEGDDALEIEYEPVAMSILQLLNQSYRFPPDMTQEQLDAWAGAVNTQYLATEHVYYGDWTKLRRIRERYDFTTEVPGRLTPTYPQLLSVFGELVDLSKRHHMFRIISLASRNTFDWAWFAVERIDRVFADMENSLEWLRLHGWPPNEPSDYRRNKIVTGRLRLHKRRSELLSPAP